MDFDDAESRVPTLELELSEEDIGSQLQVQLAKFKRVSSLSIFIEDNQADEEVTIVNKISITGWPLANTDMKNLKKLAEVKPVGINGHPIDRSAECENEVKEKNLRWFSFIDSRLLIAICR
eukprot:CAMPEP_0206199716 /NCGR_PEP_ID=MMETSP0166-20121206/10431_1 /ASSEMBLY_ACC=CAM_ASM_000260 /TAXON_ID=95228 /ORGANISM="Vannella robusta, Strain DIVA3 518/3/11/1/6" /LENGTH=120 /DNA_ID=CAMNT_0053617879 /DNA_START=244 /DNA_END=603 /DNA_ORIENTATION=-